MSAPLDAIGPLYRANLERFLEGSRVPPAQREGLLSLRVAEGPAELECWIDPATHRVAEARPAEPFRGSPLDRALLLALAQAVRGATVQDVSEHAAIRLENLLRERPTARPVPGIVQPENADPAFRLPARLARRLLAEYRACTGFTPGENREDGPAGDRHTEWGTSAVPERIQKVLDAAPETCPETGIPRDAIEVRGILHGTKVTIGFRRAVEKRLQQRYAMLLEQALQSGLDRRIEVLLEDRPDANAKRHGVLPGKKEPA